VETFRSTIRFTLISLLTGVTSMSFGFIALVNQQVPRPDTLGDINEISLILVLLGGAITVSQTALAYLKPPPRNRLTAKLVDRYREEEKEEQTV